MGGSLTLPSTTSLLPNETQASQGHRHEIGQEVSSGPGGVAGHRDRADYGYPVGARLEQFSDAVGRDAADRKDGQTHGRGNGRKPGGADGVG